MFANYVVAFKESMDLWQDPGSAMAAGTLVFVCLIHSTSWDISADQAVGS